MSLAKRLCSYLVYPVFIGGGGAAIIAGHQIGYNIGLVSTLVSVAALCGVVALERLLPFERHWLRDKQDTRTDIVHYLVNYFSKQLALLIYAATVGKISLFSSLWPAHWPFALQIVVVLIIIDLCLYWVHRLSHRSELLWYFHAVHHSSERLYWLNGEKRHPLHQVLEGLPGISIVALVGAPPPVLIAALALLGINMMLQHGNIDYKAGLFRYVFAVAENHRWHHEKHIIKSRANFGALFNIWDLLFGSYYYNGNDNYVREVGIAGEAQLPKGYLGQLNYPFMRIKAERHFINTETGR